MLQQELSKQRRAERDAEPAPGFSPWGASPFVHIHLAWAFASVPTRTGSAPPQPQAGDTTLRLTSAVRQSHLSRDSLSPQLVLLSGGLVRMQARGLYQDPTSPIWQSLSGPILCRGPGRASRVTASAPEEKNLPGHHRQIVAAVRLRSPKECVVRVTDPLAKAVTYTSLGPALEPLASRLNGAVR